MKPTKINFNLRNKADINQPIIISITGNLFEKRIRFASGLTIEPNHWDFEKQRVKHQLTRAGLINSQLNSIVTLLDNYIDKKSRLEGVVSTVDTLKTFVKVEVLKRKPKHEVSDINANSDLAVLLDEAYRILSTTTTETGTGLRKQSSLRKHQQAIAGIKAFIEYKLKQSVTLQSVSDAFLSGYKQFLAEGYNQGGNVFKSISDTTIQKHLRCTKQLIIAVVDANKATLKLPDNCMPGLDRAWKIKGINSERKLVLTTDEIEKIKNIELEPLSSEAIARDTFIMMYYTGGQRISDISTLQDSIFSEGSIHMVQKKTQSYIRIEIVEEVKAILSQYGGVFPSQAPQTTNVKLKAIAKSLGFNRKVVFKESKGGKTEIKLVNVADEIACHSARRSFATHKFLEDWNYTQIMKFTGHKSESELLKYINVEGLKAY